MINLNGCYIDENEKRKRIWFCDTPAYFFDFPTILNGILLK